MIFKLLGGLTAQVMVAMTCLHGFVMLTTTVSRLFSSMTGRAVEVLDGLNEAPIPTAVSIFENRVGTSCSMRLPSYDSCPGTQQYGLLRAGSKMG